MLLERSQQEKILDAAYACIARDGYAQTSLRQIAQEAGVAVSQISYHYENKEGLLLAVVERAATNYHEYMQNYLQPEMSPRQKGECFIALFQGVLEEDSELFRVLYDLAGLALWSPPFSLRVREVFKGIMDQITVEVFTPELVGELGSHHTSETLASLFFGGLFGIALQASLEPDNKEIIRSLSALSVVFK